MLYSTSMTMDSLYSRGQVCNLARVDTVQLGSWIRDGLIQSEDKGQRKHRRFPRIEVMLTAFLREAKRCHLNIVAMRDLCKMIRNGVELYQRHPLNYDEISHLMDLHAGEDPNTVFKAYSSNSEWQARMPLLRERVTAALSDFPYEQIECWSLGAAFSQGDGVFMIWQTMDGAWQSSSRLPFDGRMPAPSVIIFQWDDICSINWSNPGPV